MKFCMKCGAFYEEKGAKGCPRCAETARRARRRAWIELCVGIPAFIGAIYLIIYLIRTFRGA